MLLPWLRGRTPVLGLVLLLALLGAAAGCAGSGSGEAPPADEQDAGAADGAGAAGDEDADEADADQAETDADEAGADTGDPDGDTDAFPVTLTDGAGREVTVEQRPERIVAYSPSNTESLYAIGAGDRVVGVDKFSDYPAEVEEVPDVGDLYEPNYEKMVELDPDLVVITTGAEEIVARLEELGLTTLVLRHERFDDVAANLRLLGRITGERQQAEQVATSVEQGAEAVAGAVSGIPEQERLRVFYEVWPQDPLMTAGPGSFIHDMLGLAGGVNVAADAEQAWAPVDLETVVDADPDAIITPFEDSFEALSDGSREGWEQIRAVREGRVLLVEQDLVSRPGPRLVKALEHMAGWLYPEAFE